MVHSNRFLLVISFIAFNSACNKVSTKSIQEEAQQTSNQDAKPASTDSTTGDPFAGSGNSSSNSGDSTDSSTGAALHCPGAGSGIAKDPHPDDPSKEAEHDAMLSLVPEGKATHFAVKNGNWSDPSTWGGAVPTSKANVVICANVTVTLNHLMTEPIRWLRVRGELDFAPQKNTLLWAETVVIDEEGTLQIGTLASPIDPTVTAKVLFTDLDSSTIDPIYDPRQLSRGMIAHGTVRIYGAKTSPYIMAAVTPKKGDTTLTLKEIPTNWSAGTTVIVPGTVMLVGQGINEQLQTEEDEVFVTQIQGKVLTLEKPLNFDHILPDGVSLPISYLKRNVILASEHFDTLSSRGHVMFMHSPDVHVADALFDHLGRTDAKKPVSDPIVDSNGKVDPKTIGNPRGRYALHFHRAGADRNTQATVDRVAIRNSPKFGVVNHDSNVLCTSTVVYDAAGSAFFTEIGTEIGAFRNNIALHTMRGTWGGVDDRLDVLQDFGHEGVGFWLQGPGVEMTDNMSFMSPDGIIYYTFGLVIGGKKTEFNSAFLEDKKIAGGKPTISVGSVPIAKSSGNVVVAARTGLTFWVHGPLGRASVIDNTKLINIANYGTLVDYSGPIIFQNMLITGKTEGLDGKPAWQRGMGADGYHSGANGNTIMIKNTQISHFMTGISIPTRGLTRFENVAIDTIIGINGGRLIDDFIMKGVTFAHNSPLAGPGEDPTQGAYQDLMLTFMNRLLDTPGFATFDGIKIPYSNLYEPLYYIKPAGTGAPGAPSALSATLGGDGTGKVQLTWTASATPGVAYEMERATGNGTFQYLGAIGRPNYEDTGVLAGQYSYRIRTASLNGESSYSNSQTVTVTPSVVAPPQADLKLTATMGAGWYHDGVPLVNLSWTDDANNAVMYELQRSTDGILFKPFTFIEGGKLRYFGDFSSELVYGPTYYYRIRRIMTPGTQQFSNIVQSKIIALPLVPTSFTVQLAPSGNPLLKWVSPADLATWQGDWQSGIHVHRSLDGQSYQQITILPADATQLEDKDTVPGAHYWYKIYSFNHNGMSNYTPIVEIGN